MFLNRLNIGSRLVVLITVQTLVVALIGTTALLGLNYATKTTEALNDDIVEQVNLNQLNEVLRGDLLVTINDVHNGLTSWEQGATNVLSARNLFVNNWSEYRADKTAAEVQEIDGSLGREYQQVLAAIDELDQIFAAKDNDRLTDFVNNRITRQVNPFLTELSDRVAEQQLESGELFKNMLSRGKSFLYGSAAIMLVGLALATTLGFLIFRSIVTPIRKIANTVERVSQGDYYARAQVTGSDELGSLGTAFDNLLADKVATLVQAEKENEQLNESVIHLLKAVSCLSQRDLTIRVPVTEDVTGPVADALNQFTSETSRVLLGVRRISEQVARASSAVKAQSDMVISVAENEHHDVEATLKALDVAVTTMNDIAQLADACNRQAENAIGATHTALTTVTNTVEGINSIRTTIHETEKRIKRLGERSQEITRAVNLINTIAERTHILALNASMHAASAGEAGRGFAVVADEVQRLAENARDATAQISTLVSNIQVETADTVATMNDVITQVVEGTRLAEQAGTHMRSTKDSTEALVSSVRKIVSNSEQQSRISDELQTRAHQIQDSTKQTRDQLQGQTQHTLRLVQYAKSLVTAVQVFKLPVYEANPGEAAPGNGTGATESAVASLAQRKVS